MPADSTAPKKKGRPTRLDKAKKAKAAVHNLNRWLENASSSQLPPAAITSATSESNLTAKTETEATLRHYQNEKLRMLDRIDLRAQPGEGYTPFQQANQFVLDRLKAAEEFMASDGVPLSTDTNAGLARVERAVKESINAEDEGQGRSALGLLGGYMIHE